MLRIPTEHIKKVCSLESKLFLIFICSIRILDTLKVMAKKDRTSLNLSSIWILNLHHLLHDKWLHGPVEGTIDNHLGATTRRWNDDLLGLGWIRFVWFKAQKREVLRHLEYRHQRDIQAVFVVDKLSGSVKYKTIRDSEHSCLRGHR